MRKIGGVPIFWTNDFPVAALSAVSRKAHTNIPTPFDVNLPLAGTPGVECRSGGASKAYQIVFTCPIAVTFSSASVTSGAASVASTSGNGTAVVTVSVTGATNGQYITVTLAGVNDGMNTNDVAVRMGLLAGDTTGDRNVNPADIAQTKSRSGQAVSSFNFRSDLNTDGNLNSGDIAFVKSKSGTGLPPH